MIWRRRIIVHIAASADGYIARPNGNLDWLTCRPAPKGFYGMPEFARSVDAKILGRKTFDMSVELGARFSARDVHYVFSRRPPPASVPAGVQFVTQPIAEFVRHLRAQPGKNIWMMGGGEIIGPFWTRTRLTSSSSASCRRSSVRAFRCSPRDIETCPCGCDRPSPFPTASCSFTTTSRRNGLA
jgi:dihydrofolate reductase